MNTLNQFAGSILDQSLDSLADLPSFEPFPAGTHRATLKWEQKEINGKPSMVANFTYIDMVELADPNGKCPKPGDTSQVSFIFVKKDGTKNDISEGKFKAMLADLAASLELPPATGIRDIITKTDGCEIVMTNKVKPGKDGNNDTMDVLSIAVIA